MHNFIKKLIFWYFKKYEKKSWIQNEYYIIMVDKKEREEFLEFRDNVYLVYSNEEDLKKDFPEARRRNEHGCSCDTCLSKN